MLEENFKELIKKIRKDHNLTQKDLADKYHVTYQAVSKWENGKSLPDISLMFKIANDYNISLYELTTGKKEGDNISKISETNDSLMKKIHKRKILMILIPVILIVVAVIIMLLLKKSNDFESKTISSTCNDYKISGIISYNETKSVIYIPKIEYCGEKSYKKYHEINCTLYEKHKDVIKKISEFNYSDKPITIEDFMKLVTFNVDNYLKVCKSFNEESLYLEIKASDKDEMFFHTIPLTLDEKCN